MSNVTGACFGFLCARSYSIARTMPEWIMPQTEVELDRLPGNSAEQAARFMN
jgi:hypothetical protein